MSRRRQMVGVLMLVVASLLAKRCWFGEEVTYRSVKVGGFTLYLKSKQTLIYADALVDIVDLKTGSSRRQVLTEVDLASDIADWDFTVVDEHHVVVSDSFLITLP